MLKYSKLNSFFSTFNFILCVVGFQLATSLLFPAYSSIEGISHKVTIPYRAFALIVSIFVFTLNFNKQFKIYSSELKLLWIYWFFLIVRILYDTEIRFEINLDVTKQLWLYIFGICFPAMISVQKSIKEIDLDMSLKWMYISIILIILLSLYNNPALLMSSNNITERLNANVALGTIDFGHIGTMGVILSSFIMLKSKKSILNRIFLITIMLLSFFIILKAGSRSPILALFVVSIFWILARRRNFNSKLFILIFSLIFLYLFLDNILNYMGTISPLIERRLKASIFEGEMSGRQSLYQQSINAFFESPLLGSQFAIFNNTGGFGWSHNIILDSFMGLGIFGGITMIFIVFHALKYSYLLIKKNDSNYWIALLMTQQIVLSMFSSTIYFNPTLNVLLVFIFMYFPKSEKSVNYRPIEKNIKANTYCNNLQ